MGTVKLKTFNKALFALLDEFTENHSHCIFKDEETGETMFHIRCKGSFEYITIEGKIDENTIDNLREILKEMISKKKAQTMTENSIKDCCLINN